VVHTFIKSKKTNPHIDKNSKRTLYINVAKDNAFLYTKKINGIGGLPVGTSGKAVILLSGGIDSPVASFLAMKRGIEPIYLHFYAFQDYKKVAESKIPKIANKLLKYSNTAKVYYAPAHLFQIATMKIPIKYELVLFKRFMYKYAEAVAKKEDAKAIVTGESVGQVASQTIDNMQATQHGIKTLILRPLTGMDKIEIIRKAEELDTFNLSIEAYRDVCSIKIKNPTTKADFGSIDKFYQSCKLSEVLRKTMKMSFVETLKIDGEAEGNPKK
jgi:thiamine biosynthesis protein ThiI